MVAGGREGNLYERILPNEDCYDTVCKKPLNVVQLLLLFVPVVVWFFVFWLLLFWFLVLVIWFFVLWFFGS